MEKLLTLLNGMLLIVTWVLIAALIMAIPVYYLWNAECPRLFGLPALQSFWDAWKLMALASFLFKSTSSSTK